MPHYHIRSYTSERPDPPYQERVKGKPGDRMEWYRYFIVYCDEFPTLAWTLARCSVLAMATTPTGNANTNFYPFHCTGDYCNGERSLPSIHEPQRTLSTSALDSGNAVRTDEDRGEHRSP